MSFERHLSLQNAEAHHKGSLPKMKGHKFPTPNIQRVYNYFVVAAISHKCALSVSLYLDRRANKATERARTGHQQKLTRLL